MNQTPKEPVRCPKCGSTDVRYSYTQGRWDLIVDLLFSMDAFRCRSCRQRFHKFDPGDGRSQAAEAAEAEEQAAAQLEEQQPAKDKRA